MCGIAGYFSLIDSLDHHHWLGSTVEALRHRGPDDAGIYHAPFHSLGLSHTRLSVLDTSHLGHQPMVSKDGHVVLVFNGEIYNFKDLRSDLFSQGFTFSSDSDTEVLLNLYLLNRSTPNPLSFLSSLNGIFAFAIWDSLKAQLFLVRDAYGVKPLYYRESSRGFFFSSELKALPLDSLTINSNSIDHYLSYLWCPGSGTPVNEIKKLGPGESITISSDLSVDRSPWYSLLSSYSRPNSHSSKVLNSPDYYIDATEFHLQNAVHRQMVSDVPVGAFLSGGLDSSSVVAFARQLQPQLQCFTINPLSASSSELNSDCFYASQVAEHLNVPINVVDINATDFISSLNDLIVQLDEPLADPAALNVLYISQLARQSGIKVLLSGSGGDDVFSGYRRHLAVNTEFLWEFLPLRLRNYLHQLASRLDQRSSFNRRLCRLTKIGTFTSDSRIINFFRWIDRSDLIKLYSPCFRECLEAFPSDPIGDFFASIPTHISRLDQLLLLEQKFFLPDHNLLYTDKMSMACGVEVRVPFLDHDLVRFASTIPPRFKQRRDHGKWVLKKAMERHLPHDVIYRPKVGFGAPLRLWLRYELRDWLDDLLSHDSLEKRGLFDPLAVRHLINRNLHGSIDATYTLFSLACIEIWFRQYFDISNNSHSFD